MAQQRRSRLLGVLSACGLACAVLAMAWAFRSTDPERIGELLARLGAAGLALLVPQVVALTCECQGWRCAFEVMGRRLPLLGLLRARLATEALSQTLPLGVVVAESLKPALLARTCGLDLATSLAGMAVRKWLVLVSQSAYVAVFALLGYGVLARISPRLGAGNLLPLALLGASLLLCAASWLTLGLLSRGGLASRALALLSRLPGVGKSLARNQQGLMETDRLLHVYFGSSRCVRPLPWFTLAWLLELAETALLLHLLSAPLSWTTIGAVEVSASFVRNLAVLAPAGLGAQDLSYLAFFKALRLSDALHVAAAFLLLKRGKEWFWGMIGYGLLALELGPVSLRGTALRARAG